MHWLLLLSLWCEAQKGRKGLRTNRVERLEELIERSDCLNLLSPDNPEMHWELCQKPLRGGKLVYVDKTFAPGREIAEKLFAIAQKSVTPCYSSSSLKYADKPAELKNQAIEGITSVGPEPLYDYSVHQLKPITLLMGGPEWLIRTLLISWQSERLSLLRQKSSGNIHAATVQKSGQNTQVNSFNLGMVCGKQTVPF